eukprot:6480559-Amphidinium_carterae.2
MHDAITSFSLLLTVFLSNLPVLVNGMASHTYGQHASHTHMNDMIIRFCSILRSGKITGNCSSAVGNCLDSGIMWNAKALTQQDPKVGSTQMASCHASCVV